MIVFNSESALLYYGSYYQVERGRNWWIMIWNWPEMNNLQMTVTPMTVTGCFDGMNFDVESYSCM